jgi:hypothetical protein
MALTATTLSAAAAASDSIIYVTSGTGFPGVGVSSKSQRVQVDGEVMYTVDGICQVVSGQIKVRSRGSDRTSAVAHDILAPVQTSANGQDWIGIPTEPAYPGVYKSVSVGQNGVIAVPTSNTIVALTKATALGTTTLADPAADQEGFLVVLTSATNAAHVVTTVSAYDGTTGAHTTLTFAAYIGASITLAPVKGGWNVVANNGVTVT